MLSEVHTCSLPVSAASTDASGNAARTRQPKGRRPATARAVALRRSLRASNRQAMCLGGQHCCRRRCAVTLGIVKQGAKEWTRTRAISSSQCSRREQNRKGSGALSTLRIVTEGVVLSRSAAPARARAGGREVECPGRRRGRARDYLKTAPESWPNPSQRTRSPSVLAVHRQRTSALPTMYVLATQRLFSEAA